MSVTYCVIEMSVCHACGNSLETLAHFFLECPCYAAPRIALLTEIDHALVCSSTPGLCSFDSFSCEQIINILTHGAFYDALNVNDNSTVNKQIFASVSRFINKTCRFDSKI